jgi:hypothetical protein
VSYADGRDLKTPLMSPVYGDFEAESPELSQTFRGLGAFLRQHLE